MDRANKKIARGFSLLEALIALAVASIMMVVGIPGLTNLYLDNRRTSSVNDLLSGLQIARSEAIKRNRRIVICASSDMSECEGQWADGALAFVDDDNDTEFDNDEAVLHTVGNSGGVSINSDEFASFLIYRPNGRVMVDDVSVNSGELEFCDRRGSAHARVLLIDSSGRPRLSTVSAAGQAPSC
ncbi:MAG: GspH/FimT family pseudopilin [Gammaproteobacteria bacterium]|nr:GspH/FimT family pseudopilin [Gammaproteobacteria bacterium]